MVKSLLNAFTQSKKCENNNIETIRLNTPVMAEVASYYIPL